MAKEVGKDLNAEEDEAKMKYEFRNFMTTSSTTAILACKSL